MRGAAILKEPLVHFAGLALLIFALHGLLNPGSAVEASRIVVTEAKISQLAAVFAAARQRAPDAGELKALIDDHVMEEALVREALALGLDEDDTIIRRRLRQKMEFITEAEADAATPTEAELQAHLNAHPQAFAAEAMIAFEQVYLGQGQSQLPSQMGLTRKAEIAAIFGPDFADAVAAAAVGQWIGPVRSGFGLHRVRVSQREGGQVPPLSEVRAAVAREWAEGRREALAARKRAQVLEHYQVSIEGIAK